MFKTLCSQLRPGYVPPCRKKIGSVLLDKIFDEENSKLKDNALKTDSVLVLSQDGWSSVSNNPIIAHSVLVNGKSFLLNLENAGSNTKTALYCYSLTEQTLEKIKDDYGKEVTAIVTDNENKMKRFRELVKENNPNILTYGCGAHYMNLLETEITDPDRHVLKHVIEVNKHFRNVHKSLGLLREKGGKMPQLINETRWTSQIACLESYLDNYNLYREIRDELYRAKDKSIPQNVARIIDDSQIYRLAQEWLDITKRFGKALDRLQSDKCTIGEGIHIFLSLLTDDTLEQFKEDIQARFEQYLQPFMVAAYITDPRFQKDWYDMLEQAVGLDLEEKADDYMASLDDEGEVMDIYFKFKAKEKDARYFPDYMFKPRLTSPESNPAHWWKILHDKNSRGGAYSMPKVFTETMIKLHSCPASSASIERWFSTVGFVWSKERNRLGSEKAMKLAQVYRTLRQPD